MGSRGERLRTMTRLFRITIVPSPVSHIDYYAENEEDAKEQFAEKNPDISREDIYAKEIQDE